MKAIVTKLRRRCLLGFVTIDVEELLSCFSSLSEYNSEYWFQVTQCLFSRRDQEHEQEASNMVRAREGVRVSEHRQAGTLFNAAASILPPLPARLRGGGDDQAHQEPQGRAGGAHREPGGRPHLLVHERRGLRHGPRGAHLAARGQGQVHDPHARPDERHDVPAHPLQEARDHDRSRCVRSLSHAQALTSRRYPHPLLHLQTRSTRSS